ncbi:hypothetical protein BYT27DRAFT_7183069 [Phlegmacium glaucopus]|nr:hypothetical protein BYT27DRAFT_7183069 [Phlegmacium glaucopus]
MSSHPKAVIIKRDNILGPGGEAQSGRIVSVSINSQTVVTIFGVVNSRWNQVVQANLIGPDMGPPTTVLFDGRFGESLQPISPDEPAEKTITWGPFDEQMTIELIFFHWGHGGLNISTIKDDKMKEYTSNDLRIAATLIPIQVDGDGDDVQVSFNVTRMTLF